MANLANMPQEDYVSDDFELLPAGVYPVKITASELATTKSGNGQLLKLTLQVIEGPGGGRMVWESLNIIHTNAEAQKIGQRQFAQLRAALGLGAVSDSEELHDRPLRIRLKIEPGKDGFQPRNRVSAFLPYNDPGPAAAANWKPGEAKPSAAQFPQKSAPPPSSAPKQRPWG
jgi:hypothetical protein